MPSPRCLLLHMTDEVHGSLGQRQSHSRHDISWKVHLSRMHGPTSSEFCHPDLGPRDRRGQGRKPALNGAYSLSAGTNSRPSMRPGNSTGAHIKSVCKRWGWGGSFATWETVSHASLQGKAQSKELRLGQPNGCRTRVSPVRDPCRSSAWRWEGSWGQERVSWLYIQILSSTPAF